MLVLVVLALSACGGQTSTRSSDDVDSSSTHSSSGTASSSTPPDSPTESTSTFVPVTDSLGGALTEEQRDEIIERCREHAGIPGGNRTCTELIPRDLPPCTPRDNFCLRGAVTGGQAGVVQVVDQRGPSPTCPEALCETIVVPATVVQQLVATRTTTPPTDESPTVSPTDESPTAGTASPTPSPTP